jgi:hypothetical protein
LIYLIYILNLSLTAKLNFSTDEKEKRNITAGNEIKYLLTKEILTNQKAKELRTIY